MKAIVLSLFICASVVCLASAADVPPLSVRVADGKGKVVYSGLTKGDGTFSTAKLPAGTYLVQFGTSKSLPGAQFKILLAGGGKKVDSPVFPGEKLTQQGAVAANLTLGGEAAISGKVMLSKAAGPAGLAKAGAANGMSTQVKYVDGKKYVWLPPETGSHVPGRWVPADEVEAHSTGVKRASASEFQDARDRSSR